MKAYITLSLLVAAVFAAPQQQNASRDNKPFIEEPATIDTSCYKGNAANANRPWINPTPRTPTNTEDCIGTIKYCLGGFYKKHGEDFADADACLWSRGKDPKTLPQNNGYDAGIMALSQANEIFNRYILISLLIKTHVADDKDKEGEDLIEQLRESNESRWSLARELVDLAKSKLATALGPEFSGEINQAIEEAKAKLNAAWDQVQETNVKHLSQLEGWVRGKAEKKNYKSW